MNYTRLALAAVAAWVVDLAYGFIVFSQLLGDMFNQNPALYPQAEMNLTTGFVSSLIGFFVFSYVYAKGYEGGNRVQEGIRFGVLVGLLIICFGVVWEYVTVRVSSGFAMATGLATLIEFVVAGTVVGFVYRPLAPAGRPAL
ncbi:MAG: hypothetical protein HYX76_06665 [Acidobacteria bacterium]|nr:hypothetical protein [Acidobacteriota bacterium]